MATPNLYASTSAVPTLLSSSQLASGDNTIYTVPASKGVKLAKMVLTNVSGAAVVVSVSIVPSGGSVSTTHRVVSGYSLAAGDSTIISEIDGMMLGDGDFVSVNSAAATAIDCVLSGVLFA
jgi:hypothetical protein